MRLARSRGGLVHRLAHRLARRPHGGSYEVTLCGDAFCTDETLSRTLDLPWRPVRQGRLASVTCMACLAAPSRRRAQ